MTSSEVIKNYSHELERRSRMSSTYLFDHVLFKMDVLWIHSIFFFSFSVTDCARRKYCCCYFTVEKTFRYKMCFIKFH